MIIYELRGVFNKNPIISKILKINFHMSFHNFARMVWQNRQGYRKILTIKTCCFLWHLISSHQIIKHINISLKPYSNTSNIILLINQFSFIQYVIQCRSEYLIARIAINSNEIVIDYTWCC